MKKLISAILLSIVMTIIPIYASDINVSEMKTEELLALKSSIETELSNRGENGERLEVSNAVYIAGKDIAPGQYKIECVDEFGYLGVKIYKDGDSYDNDAETHTDGLLTDETLLGLQSMTVKLEENEILKIDTIGTPGFLSKYESSILLN